MTVAYVFFVLSAFCAVLCFCIWPFVCGATSEIHEELDELSPKATSVLGVVAFSTLLAFQAIFLFGMGLLAVMLGWR
jgi:hypothetical protein